MRSARECLTQHSAVRSRNKVCAPGESTRPEIPCVRRPERLERTGHRLSHSQGWEWPARGRGRQRQHNDPVRKKEFVHAAHVSTPEAQLHPTHTDTPTVTLPHATQCSVTRDRRWPRSGVLSHFSSAFLQTASCHACVSISESLGQSDQRCCCS